MKLLRPLADFFLVDMAKQTKEPVKFVDDDLGCLVRRVELVAESLKLLRQLEGKLDAGEVHVSLLDEIFHLPKPFDIFVGVESKVAGRARWRDQALAFIFPEGLGVHLDKPSGDTDDKQWF